MPMWVDCVACSHRVAFPTEPDAPPVCPQCGAKLPPPPPCDVFVSYATPDIGVAQEICNALATRQVGYWFAPESIRTGDSFVSSIMDGLPAVRVVALVLSRAATKSPWVKAEVVLATSAGIPVLPFRIEEFELPKEFRLLLALSQWQNAYAGPGDAQIERFAARVEQKLREQAGVVVEPE